MTGIPQGLSGSASLKEGEIPAVSVIAVMNESNAAAIESALKADVSGFLSRTSPTSQIVSALLAAASGGIMISPSMLGRIIAIGARGNSMLPPRDLTRRELDVLRLLIDGNSVGEIAEKLSISYHTVDAHLKNLHRKFDVKSSRSLIAIAMRRGLI